MGSGDVLSVLMAHAPRFDFATLNIFATASQEAHAMGRDEDAALAYETRFVTESLAALSHLSLTLVAIYRDLYLDAARRVEGFGDR